MRRFLCTVMLASALLVACNSDENSDGKASGETETVGKTLATGGTTPADHSVRMRGMYIYMADAALFTDCATGKKYPVATEGDNIALERAYLEARPAAGEPVLVVIHATVDMRPPMEGEGVVETLIVKKFEAVKRGEVCDGAVTDEAVENKLWRLVAFADAPIELGPKQRAPDLRLQSTDHMAQGFAGCNRFSGEYDIEQGNLVIGPVAMTRMLCEKSMDLEERFGQMLGAVRTYTVADGSMELFGADGLLARFDEVKPQELR